MEVVGEAANTDALLARVGEACPDLVLLDCGLASSKTVDLVTDLRTLCPGLAIIALGGLAESCPPSWAAQVDAYVSKGDAPEELVAALSLCLSNNSHNNPQARGNHEV